MFEMSLPWWHFVARSAIVFCALLLMVRVSGRRTVGQFTPFDLLVVMLLSEAVSNSLAAEDHSITGGVIVAATLVAMNMIASYMSSHHPIMANLLDGTPMLLGRDGKIFPKALKHCRLSATEFAEALRQADCTLEEMQYAILEADGSITIMKKR